MNHIYTKLFDFLEIGDNCPTIIMGVLNLSPESFYKGSIYNNLDQIERATFDMVKNGAKILDLGGRSTAPWSKTISVQEELDRMISALEIVCKVIPNNIIISIDTQYKVVAEKSYKIANEYERNIIVNDVSCFKTDSTLEEFITENQIPVVLMASKQIPGDLLTIDEIINEFKITIERLESKGFEENKIILDPGIGHWIEKKTFEYDLKIISNLERLKILNKPILVALSRKSFIAGTLDKYKDSPEKRYNGTLSATAIAIYNGAHIIRTHDVNNQLFEIIKIAEEIRKSK
jgi:dihydropteroate synthase